jgi:hypothetical protein
MGWATFFSQAHLVTLNEKQGRLQSSFSEIEFSTIGLLILLSQNGALLTGGNIIWIDNKKRPTQKNASLALGANIV